jgi:hypothetical protein
MSFEEMQELLEKQGLNKNVDLIKGDIWLL